MRLFIETPPGPSPLADHIEIGVRIAGMKLADARRMQSAAALNTDAVRDFMGRTDPDEKHHHRMTGWLRATEAHAAEQYAYARYLLGIDTYWETLPHYTTKQRMDYILEGEHK